MGSARHCLPLLLYSAFGVLCTSIPPLVFSMVLTIKRKKVLLIFNKWYFVTALTVRKPRWQGAVAAGKGRHLYHYRW